MSAPQPDEVPVAVVSIAGRRLPLYRWPAEHLVNAVATVTPLTNEISVRVSDAALAKLDGKLLRAMAAHEVGHLWAFDQGLDSTEVVDPRMTADRDIGPEIAADYFAASVCGAKVVLRLLHILLDEQPGHIELLHRIAEVERLDRRAA